MSNKATLVEGPIAPALARLAVPMSIGIVFIVAVNLVDSYFVGQLGTPQLAAMSFTFPVVLLTISVAMGLGIGTTSAVSRALGAGDEQAVRELTTHALLLATVIVAGVSVLGIWLQEPIFTLLGAPADVLPLLREYMTVWFAGVVFLVVPMVANGVLRAGGDARAPMVMMAGAALINGALDPLFIFGWGPVPALGLAGAAYATLIARSVTLVGALWLLTNRGLIDWHRPKWTRLIASFRAVLSVGAPAAITNALAPVASGVMTMLIAREGSAAVAAYGIGSRLEGLLLIAPFGLTASLTPFIGQNWGAYRTDRVATGVKLSVRFVSVWGALACLVLLIGEVRTLFAGLFTDDPEVIRVTSLYLLIVPVSYAAAGIVSVASASFNAIDRAIRSTLLSLAKSLGLAVPLAWLGASLGGLTGLFVGIGLATVVASIVALRWLRVITHPEPVTQDLPAAKADARSSHVDVREFVDALVDRVSAHEDITICPRPIHTVGFYAYGYELGHVHRDGRLDLHLPPSVLDVLVCEGALTHHCYQQDTAWASLCLRSEKNLDQAETFLRLEAALVGACRQSGDGLADALETLELSSAVTATALEFVASRRTDVKKPGQQSDKR